MPWWGFQPAGKEPLWMPLRPPATFVTEVVSQHQADGDLWCECGFYFKCCSPFVCLFIVWSDFDYIFDLQLLMISTISRCSHNFESPEFPPFTFRWIKTWNASFYCPNWELSESCEEEAGSEPRKCIVKYSRSFHWGVRQIMNC